MNATGASRQKRTAILILRFSLIAVFLLIAYSWLQPFSKKFEGKTARDWFLEWKQTRKIRADVIDAFGAEPVPMLLAEVMPTGFMRMTWAFLSHSSASSLMQRLRIGQGTQIAVDWLTVLHHRGGEVLPAVIEAGQTNLISTIYSYHTDEELDRIIREEANSILVDQAKKAKAMRGAAGFAGGVERLLWQTVTNMPGSRRERKVPQK
jgi:hypothetical protein